MQQAETQLQRAIDNNQEIGLKDNKWVRAILPESQDLREQCAMKKGAIDESIGYYLSNIFDHFRKQAIDKQQNILRIESQTNEMGWIFPILFRRDSPNEIIAKAIPGNVDRLRKLKSLIENEGDVIIPKLAEFQKNINYFESQFNQFLSNIDKITHNARSLRLKGHCSVEHELMLRYWIRRIFRNK